MDSGYTFSAAMIVIFVIVYAILIFWVIPDKDMPKINALLQVLMAAFIGLQVLTATKNIKESIKSRINLDELKLALIGYIEEEVLPKVKKNITRNSGFEEITPVETFLRRDYIRAQSQKLHSPTQVISGYNPSVIELGHIVRISRKIDILRVRNST
ncbi:hypothetical protein [Thermococcus barossii]|uniref:Uncharacterized protein n=1 Tax=Thermococcus barossii TaxID=54077 RepID=A0A2Z2MH77_9EURY|nr:hypothetical protein [Thermococcus barossii]ASJ04859.1 hypothetical protein A3L01_05575 [Thermococcus barossii]